jgi:hypothetical protein
MDDTATMLTAAEPLDGVKTTLNRLAVKLESSWHVLSELDESICWSADAGERMAAREERRRSGFPSEKRILGDVLFVNLEK